MEPSFLHLTIGEALKMIGYGGGGVIGYKIIKYLWNNGLKIFVKKGGFVDLLPDEVKNEKVTPDTKMLSVSGYEVRHAEDCRKNLLPIHTDLSWIKERHKEYDNRFRDMGNWYNALNQKLDDTASAIRTSLETHKTSIDSAIDRIEIKMDRVRK